MFIYFFTSAAEKEREVCAEKGKEKRERYLLIEWELEARAVDQM